MSNNSMANLDWTQLLGEICESATSETARDQLRQLSPANTVEEARERCSEVLQAQSLLLTQPRPHMESVDLFPVWFQRLQKAAVLKPLEFKDVRSFCIEAYALSEVLKTQSELEWTGQILDGFLPAEEIISAIDQVMTLSGEIRSDASETLYNLFKEKEDKTRHLQKLLDTHVKKHELENVLQDRYVTNREGRWVLPVKSGMQHQFGGVIHASSQSKQTVFMEPQEVIPINNNLRQIEQGIEEEIERLLTELTNYLTTHLKSFEKSQISMLEADVCFAKAQLSSRLNAQVPVFTEKEINLQELKHPLLVLNEEQVIANTVELSKERTLLLLSGPNAGGKTVLLKAIGLAAQMARCGLPICANEDSKLPFFTELHIGIGDSQSVDENLSTFAAHLKILDESSKAKGFDQLILIDEICGSTDPEEGAALARSFLKTYAENDVFAIVTSHLGALKRGWEENSKVVNGSMEFDKEKGPSYQFLMGIPGQSLALQTAQRVGVNKNIIEQAIGFLSPDQQRYLKNLNDAEEVKEQLMAVREELKQKTKEMNKAKSKYEAELLRFEKDRDKMLKKAVEEAEKNLEAMVRNDKVDNIFKKHENLQTIRKQMPQVVKSKDQKLQSLDSPEQFREVYPPGTKIFVPHLKQDGIVQGEPNSKGEVPILCQSMRLSVHWQELKPPAKSQNPTQQILRNSSGSFAQVAGGDRTIDLRGMTTDEAIEHIEKELDSATVTGQDRVKVVHGHGTEALKRAVRSHLSRSPYVQKWQAGSKHTGGDGVTWAEIKI